MCNYGTGSQLRSVETLRATERVSSDERFRGPVVLRVGVLSPVHYSRENGVHADLCPLKEGEKKLHVPYVGQTILSMWDVGRKKSYEDYELISRLALGALDGNKAR